MANPITSEIRSYHFFNDGPDEVLCLIFSALDFKTLFTSVSLVCRRFKAISRDDVLVRKILSTESIYFLECDKRNIPLIQKYQQRLLKLKSPVPHAEWNTHSENQIHIWTRAALNSLLSDNFEINSQNLRVLLKIQEMVNSSSSAQETPLLMVCRFIEKLFPAQLGSVERQRIYQQYESLLGGLLEASADPNYQGYPSIPLMIFLMQEPFAEEDARLRRACIEKLLRAGADPDLKPVKDHYNSSRSPLEHARRFCPTLVELLKKYSKERPHHNA